MRVIAGKFRRRSLASLEGAATRPMLGRLRQTLFDVLQGEVEGRVFADLYAGTGAVGIEALSRGAERAVFVESSAAAADLIHRNLRALGAQGQAQVRVARVEAVLAEVTADIYFLGPPYEAVREYQRTLETLGQRPSELVVAQHARTLELQADYGLLSRERVIRVGRSCLSLFRWSDGSSSA